MSKILVITGLFPYKDNPAPGSFIKDQVEILQDKYNVDVAVIRPIKEFQPSKRKYNHDNLNSSTRVIEQKYISLPRHFLSNLVGYLLYISFNKKFNINSYDAIYVHSILPAGIVIPFIRKSGYNKPIIIMAHGGDWWMKWNNNYLKNNIENILHYSTNIWVSGPELAENMVQNLPQFDTKITVVYNIIPPQLTQEIEVNKEAIRAKLGWPNDNVELLCLSYLAPVKGVDILIEALANIPSHIWNRIQIFGDSPDSKYRDRLINRIQELKLEKKIILAGTVTRKELKELYTASDIYVLASRNEGFNVSLLEAAYLRVPSVATKVGGSHLLINNHSFLPKKNSVHDLKLSIEKMITDYKNLDINTHYDYEFINENCTSYALLRRFDELLC